MTCPSCSEVYEGSWWAHTQSNRHQRWIRWSGARQAQQLASLDEIFARRLAEQKVRATGQTAMFDE